MEKSKAMMGSSGHALLPDCLVVAAVLALVLALVAAAWPDSWSGVPGPDLRSGATPSGSPPVAMPVTTPVRAERMRIPQGLRAAVQSAVEKDSYEIKRNHRHSPVPGSHQALNRAHGFRIGFSGGGIHLRPHPHGAAGDWEMEMSLCGIGYGDLEQTTGEGRLKAAADRIDYRRVTAAGKSLMEWYVNSPRGLEQGFTLPVPPGVRRNQEDALRVEFTVSGNVRPSLAHDRQSITFVTSDGRQAVRYSELHVYDALGSELPAHMVVQEKRVALCVDDTAATYPLTIDPLFTTETKLTAGDGAANDAFGFSVALSGDTALVGAPLDDDASFQSGSAYVFVRSGTTWSQQAKLVAGDGAGGDVFGRCVALSGDTALIGARGDDDAGTDSGSAYVFVRSGTTWSQEAKLVASDAASFDLFGESVALSGDTALVGADREDSVGFDSGSAYVFVRSGTTWSQQAKLVAGDAAASDQFGISVALDGDTALVGAHLEDAAGTDSGSAYVFVRSGTTWSQQAKLAASDGGAFDRFGISVAVSGDTALVGAFLDDDAGSDSGSAYVFARSSATWTQQQKLAAGDAAAGDNFGRSVALSGDTALVGAFLDDDAGSDSGSAYVFASSSASWTQQQKLTANDGAAGDRFGVSVALDGDMVLVGARLDDDKGTDSGSVYVYEQEAVSDDQGPATTAVTATPNPVAVGTTVCLTANVDDTGLGDSGIASAEYSLDGGAFTPMSAADGTFDEVGEDVTSCFTAPAVPGIYNLCVRGTDAASNVGDPECIMLVVYDPTGAFVTGGGWIDSPAGAWKYNPSLTGKASFGFVSRYKKGATVPTGVTVFQFKAGDLNFHSSSYEFLVITMDDTNAQYKGSGTINGNLAPNATPFKFMVWATDNSTDTFRIRIWWEDGIGENVVYDNGSDQAIAGGSIVIHTK